jgi:hypothetical protein
MEDGPCESIHTKVGMAFLNVHIPSLFHQIILYGFSITVDNAHNFFIGPALFYHGVDNAADIGKVFIGRKFIYYKAPDFPVQRFGRFPRRHYACAYFRAPLADSVSVNRIAGKGLVIY